MIQLRKKQATPVVFLVLVFLIALGCRNANEKLSESSDQVGQSHTWEEKLKHEFRKSYGTAVQTHREKMHKAYPVITQDLLNMTLIRSNGDSIRFKMKDKVYQTLAHTSHPSLVIYSILYASQFDINPLATKELRKYHQLLKEAEEGVKKAKHLTVDQTVRIVTVFEKSMTYIESILKKKNTDKEEFQKYTYSLKDVISKNFYDGAKDQLDQFRTQLNHWKKVYPDEDWNELRVVILGFHQPRELYTTKLFFQWLLEEPNLEEKVVYAEFQFSIFCKEGKPAKNKAIELLTKVDLEKELSCLVLGDETLLQQDALGPSAQEIIEGWGQTDWFQKN